MAGNSTLNAAAKAKQDEFYTQLSDIENELGHYKQHFKGKTVLCNCDDPFESNFFKYFALNFNYLGLKKLICTCYAESPVIGNQLLYSINENNQMSILFGDEIVQADANIRKRPYKAIVTTVHDATGNGGIVMEDIAELFKTGENQLTELEGDGDFRSPECLALLDEADIVVTNPPFSLFRNYVATLMEYNKKFIIIGNKNSITYKEIFPLIKNNQLWTGYRGFSGGMWFYSDYEGKTEKYINGRRLINVPTIWYTNLDIRKRHENLIMIHRYNQKDYPCFDNYNAINVNAVANIPCDYPGVMGVPITFLDKYNPDQFEIIGLIAGNIKGLAGIPSSTGKDGPYLNGKLKYGRILVRNKYPE